MENSSQSEASPRQAVSSSSPLSPQEPLPSNNKWIVPLAVLIAGIVGYFVFAYTLNLYPFLPKPEIVEWTPRPTPEDVMAGWQTYRNEEYGFELKYPKFASIEELTDVTSVGTVLPKFAIKTNGWEFEIFSMPETHGRGEIVFAIEEEFQTNVGGRNFLVDIYRPLTEDELNDRYSEFEKHYTVARKGS